jgi:hypothetical protein
MSERAARIGEWRLGAPRVVEPGALDAGDRAVQIGNGREQGGPGFERRIGFGSGDRPTGGNAARASRAVQ